jgi:hypothetical protein
MLHIDGRLRDSTDNWQRAAMNGEHLNQLVWESNAPGLGVANLGWLAYNFLNWTARTCY